MTHHADPEDHHENAVQHMLRVVPETSDAALIAAAQHNGDAFAALYDRYASQLYRYAYRRVGREVAEDVVANTFLAAFRARGRYDSNRADARPWLYAILTKELARHHRTEMARYRMLTRAGYERTEDVHVFADRVADYVTAQAVRAPLAEALGRLPARDRDVLLLIAWGDLTYEEVAEALAIPIGTVRSRLNRARRKIRLALGHDNSLEHPS